MERSETDGLSVATGVEKSDGKCERNAERSDKSFLVTSLDAKK
jgi:hypothetical protein